MTCFFRFLSPQSKERVWLPRTLIFPNRIECQLSSSWEKLKLHIWIEHLQTTAFRISNFCQRNYCRFGDPRTKCLVLQDTPFLIDWRCDPPTIPKKTFWKAHFTRIMRRNLVNEYRFQEVISQSTVFKISHPFSKKRFGEERSKIINLILWEKQKETESRKYEMSF